MKFENIKVFNFEGAFRGMRNPKESWGRSDSSFYSSIHMDEIIKAWENNEKARIKLKDNETYEDWLYRNGSHLRNNSPLDTSVYIGPDDMRLAQTLIRAGSVHRKFMREIMVSIDITAPLYWWKEFDTYKVGTVANSTSTMHKLASTPITMDCFEIDDYNGPSLLYDDDLSLDCDVKDFINTLEWLRERYIKTKDKRYWKELIRWLPESWLQTRTITMSYENLYAMCSKDQRRFHKLNEWSGIDDPDLENFISMVRKLPYAQELIFIDELFEDEEKEKEELIKNGIKFKELLEHLEELNNKNLTYEDFYDIFQYYIN